MLIYNAKHSKDKIGYTYKTFLKSQSQLKRSLHKTHLTQANKKFLESLNLKLVQRKK